LDTRYCHPVAIVLSYCGTDSDANG
jgi:hypothetical protein